MPSYGDIYNGLRTMMVMKKKYYNSSLKIKGRPYSSMNYCSIFFKIIVISIWINISSDDLGGPVGT